MVGVHTASGVVVRVDVGVMVVGALPRAEGVDALVEAE